MCHGFLLWLGRKIELNRREVCECDGWVCVCETIYDCLPQFCAPPHFVWTPHTHRLTLWRSGEWPFCCIQIALDFWQLISKTMKPIFTYGLCFCKSFASIALSTRIRSCREPHCSKIFVMTRVHSRLLGAASRHVGISGFEPAWWEQDENIWARTSDAEMDYVFEVQQVFVRQPACCEKVICTFHTLWS